MLYFILVLSVFQCIRGIETGHFLSIPNEVSIQNTFLVQMPDDILTIIIKSVIENDSSNAVLDGKSLFIQEARAIHMPTDLTQSYNKVFLPSSHGFTVYVFDTFKGDIAQIRNLKALMLTNKHFCTLITKMMSENNFVDYFTEVMYQNLTNAFSPRWINQAYKIYFAALLHNKAGDDWIFKNVEYYNRRLLEIPGHFNMVVAPIATYNRFESKTFQEFKIHVKAFNI